MIRNGRRTFALVSIVVVLTAMVGTIPAHADAEPPTPIPPGEYLYRGSYCYSFISPVHSEGGCGDRPSKLVVDAPTGSTQRTTERDNCRDYVHEETVDYQPDGIHLLQTYTDHGGRLGTNGDPDCGLNVSLTVCNPIPAPLILPTGAKPGQHLSYTMVCAPYVVHQVAIDIVGTKKVMIGRKWETTLVIRTRDELTSPRGPYVLTQEDWVIPRNGLVVFSKWRAVSNNVFVIMRETLNFKSVLSTCSTCP